MIKNLLKYVIISFIFLGVAGLGTSYGSVYAAQSQANLNQKLKKTNEQKKYYHEKKKQTDLKLRTERNRLSNNQQ